MLISAIKRQKKEYFTKGLKRGSLKEKAVIARRLLAEGLEIPFIAQVTGLSEAAVLELKNALDERP